MILAGLCQDYDLEVARTTGVINLQPGIAGFSSGFNTGFATNSGSGPYILPATYLRMASNEAFYYVYGVPYVMINIDLAEYDALVQQAGISNYPEKFATDDSGGLGNCLLYCWPPSGGAYNLNIRFYQQMPDITTPETSATIPWFPKQDYLVTRLAAELMQIAADAREDKYRETAEEKLRAYLKMQNDDDGRAKTVQLDRRRFGASFNRLPQTKTLGW